MRKCKQQGYEHIEILGSTWFTPARYQPLEYGNIACIGIVKTKDTITKEINSYIGYGIGKDIIFDEDYIIASGTKLKKDIQKKTIEFKSDEEITDNDIDQIHNYTISLYQEITSGGYDDLDKTWIKNRIRHLIEIVEKDN